MRATTTVNKLRRFGLLGLAAAALALNVGTSTARADDDHRGRAWHKHEWRHDHGRHHHRHPHHGKKHHDHVVVLERAVPVHAYPPPSAYVYEPAPMQSFSFQLTWY
jgi:hypothetical protein